MIWLNNIIIPIVREFIKPHQKYIYENTEKILELEKRINFLSEEIEIKYKINHLKIDQKERFLREEMELSLTGLISQIDKKFESLGDKKGIVTDLLKRIAFLEGEVEDKNVRQ